MVVVDDAAGAAGEAGAAGAAGEAGTAGAVATTLTLVAGMVDAGVKYVVVTAGVVVYVLVFVEYVTVTTTGLGTTTV